VVAALASGRRSSPPPLIILLHNGDYDDEANKPSPQAGTDADRGG